MLLASICGWYLCLTSRIVMNEWKLKKKFRTRGEPSLAEIDIHFAIEPGDGPKPGFLTIDIYPVNNPNRPARHFGTWQFPFDDLQDVPELVLTVDTGGAALSRSGKSLPPVKVIEGKLREDGLYIVYLVLVEKGTYGKIYETDYYRLISFSGAQLNPSEYWPDRYRRNLKTVQPEYWMMRRLLEAVDGFAAELPAKSSVLDCGGGEAPYRPLFADRGLNYTNADVVDGQFVDILCDENAALPFGDESFDAVLCTHVLEHVPDPAGIVSEIFRVLKKDGRLLVAVPFAWEEHNQPNDFRRFGRDGLHILLEKFRDIKISADSNAAQALIMLRISNYYRTIKNRFLRDALIRLGNFRCRTTASCCNDYDFSCNYNIIAMK